VIRFHRLAKWSEMSGLWSFSRWVQSWSDEIESHPVLFWKIFENHQSDPASNANSCVFFASWGKRTTGAILPLAKCDWLKGK